MDRALELGVNFFDTANAYGGSGRSRGDRGDHRPLVRRPTRRRVTTSCWRRRCTRRWSLRRPTADVVNARGASAWQVRREAIASLAAPADRPDRPVPVPSHRPAHLLAGAVAGDGGARRAGRGRLHRQLELRRVEHRAGERGRVSSDTSSASSASSRSTTSHSARSSSRSSPPRRTTGSASCPGRRLSGGLLSGGSSDPKARSNAGRVAAAPRLEPSSRTSSTPTSRFAAERGWTPSSLGLAWLLHQPGVTGPIIGPRTVEQLESAVAALDIELSDDDLTGLDELFPGPGGQAPEAYAW